MKQLFTLLIFTCSTLFAQTPYHFLIASKGEVQITEPLCEEMIKETSATFEQFLSDAQKEIKKEKIELTMGQKAHLETAKLFAQNVRTLAPSFILKNILGMQYGMIQDSEPFFSLESAQINELGPVSITIELSNVLISPTETSMDVTVSNPTSSSSPISAHFNIATGVLLDLVEGQPQMVYYAFWSGFAGKTNLEEWTTSTIALLNPNILSRREFIAKLEAPIRESRFMQPNYLSEARQQAQRILKGLPYAIPFDKSLGILISEDESKIILRTYEEEFFYIDDESQELMTQAKYSAGTDWLFSKSDGSWRLYKDGNTYFNQTNEDSLQTLVQFYRMGFVLEQNLMTYDEKEWTSLADDYQGYIEFKHVISSEENRDLIHKYIHPQLEALFNQENFLYSNYYQRTNEAYHYWMDENEQYVSTDMLIANPEKTAFIYPVLMNHKQQDESDYYSTNEDFKFFVLLKNNNGEFTLYDWHYYRNLPYKSGYELNACIDRHLSHITAYHQGQEVITDTAFWNNFVFKTSRRGYDYLNPVVSINESVKVTKNQFDAQVIDCIALVKQYDISNLHKNQLLQLMRCINTIEKWHLQSDIYNALIGLSRDLYIEDRIKKVNEQSNGYYPKLDIEFNTNLNPHSYYILE